MPENPQLFRLPPTIQRPPDSFYEKHYSRDALTSQPCA